MCGIRDIMSNTRKYFKNYFESRIAQNWPKRFSLNFVSTLSTPFKVFLQNLNKFLCLGAEI